MKKRLVASLMAMVLVGSLLTGCGETEQNASSAASTEESKSEESTEASSEESTEASSEESVEESTEESTEESSEEESTEETTEEESTEESSEEVVAATGEWAEAYEGYLQRDNILPENFEMTADMEEEGMAMTMVIAKYENQAVVSMFADNAGTKGGFAAYVTEDYSYINVMASGENMWVKAQLQDASDVTGLGDDMTGIVDDAEECTYVGEVVEGGVTYDVLSAESDGQEIQLFVNRDTQYIEKMVVEAEGTDDVVMNVSECNGIDLPAEAADAEEVGEDEFAMYIFAGMMAMMPQE